MHSIPNLSRQPLGRRLPARRTVLSLLALLLLWLAGCATPLGQQSPTPTPRPAPPLVLDLARFNLCAQTTDVQTCPLEKQFCPMDTQWSPDGARIAALSWCRGLPRGLPSVNHLLLFDAHTGALAASVDLDALVQTAAPYPATCDGVPIRPNLFAARLAWTPDSKRLVISIERGILTPYQLPADCGRYAADGVVLLDATGQRLALYTHQGPSAVRWDVRTGQPLLAPSYAPNSEIASDMPPALAYRWGDNGTLTALGALVPASRPTGVPTTETTTVGNAQGGATFGIWQPGVVQYFVAASAGPTETRGAYLWSTDFAATSPDGQWVAPAMDYQADLVPDRTNPPSQQEIAALADQYLPITSLTALPVRDKGLASALAAMPAPAPQSATSGVIRATAADFAWRPDGQVLAMSGVSCDLGCEGGAASLTTVRLFDTATGQQLAALTPPDGPALGLLRWSADGRRLLLLNTTTLTLWTLE